VDRELGPFECGTEQIHCDRECGEKVSGLLGIEVNSGFQATSLGDRICELEDRRVIKPGLDYYVSLSVASEQYNTVYMGRVCCGPRGCSCELVYNGVTRPVNTTTSQISSRIASLDAWLPGGKGYFYECDEDRRICAEECRLAAGEYFKSTAMNESSADAFGEFGVAAEVCRLLGKAVELPGYDIYLRSSSESEEVSQDVHIGRLCCRPFYDGFLPVNRCQTLTMPVV